MSELTETAIDSLQQAWVAKRLDEMLAKPDDWGHLQAFEYQFCLLLEVALVLRGTPDPTGTVGKAYVEVRREQDPMVGYAVAAWSTVGFVRKPVADLEAPVVAFVDKSGALLPGEFAWQNMVQFFSALRKRLGV